MQILKEAKQVGILYHVTDIDGFIGILKDNQLGKYRDSFVSFSRDPRYTYVAGTARQSTIQLVVDGNKLSTRYKVVPYASAYVGNRLEAEERVEEPIKDIGKYLLEIRPLRKDVKYERLIPKKTYFEFLEKYPQIKNFLLSEEMNPLTLEKNVSGIYKDGKRVKPFTLETADKVCWDFFKLAKMYADDEDYEGAYFSGFDPDYSLDTKELDGYDLVYVSGYNQEIVIRAKNKNRYKWLQDYGTLRFTPYVSPFEGENYG